MNKIIHSKILIMFLIFSIVLTGFGTIVSADGGPGNGWKAVVDKEGPSGVRVIISTPHYGWCAPYTERMHINMILRTNGADTANYHMWLETNSKGKKCVKAYESVSKSYYNFKKCHDNTDGAIQELLTSEGQYSVAERIKKALPIAIVGVIVIWLIKIILSIVLGNPAPMLLPI